MFVNWRVLYLTPLYGDNFNSTATNCIWWSFSLSRLFVLLFAIFFSSHSDDHFHLFFCMDSDFHFTMTITILCQFFFHEFSFVLFWKHSHFSWSEIISKSFLLQKSLLSVGYKKSDSMTYSSSVMSEVFFSFKCALVSRRRN